MSKFKVGDVVVRVESQRYTQSNSKCFSGGPVSIIAIKNGNECDLVFSEEDGGEGWDSRYFELYKPASKALSFNPLKDPWYILTPTKEAFDEAVAWAKSVGFVCNWKFTPDSTYIRSDIEGYTSFGGKFTFVKYTRNHKQVTLTKSITYQYNIVEEETEEQKEAKKKAEEINAVRIEMEALAKRLKDLEG